LQQGVPRSQSVVRFEIAVNALLAKGSWCNRLAKIDVQQVYSWLSLLAVPSGKLVAYNGLLYVSGRALRPDIAVRLVYAMSKEGLAANENSLNSYRSGKRLADDGTGFRSRLARRLKLIDPYESILYVECTKYDSNDRRRTGEQRVRIIV